MKKKRVSVCTSGIIVNERKQVLIVKRSDTDDFLPGYWEFPGGGLEYGEHPDEGIKRELFEECGIRISKSLPYIVKSYVGYEKTPREKQYIEIFYLCEHEASQEVVISFEHSAYRWVHLHEVEDMYMTDYIKEIFRELRNHPHFLSSRMHGRSHSSGTRV